MISDARFEEQIAEECPGLDATIRKSTVRLLKATAALIQSSKPASYLVEGDSITKSAFDELASAHPKTTLHVGRGLVERLRERKDAEEIRAIERAIAIAEKAFQDLKVRLKADMTEKQLADELEYAVRRAGESGPPSKPSSESLASRFASWNPLPTPIGRESLCF